jgi:hypothetical protein
MPEVALRLPFTPLVVLVKGLIIFFPLPRFCSLFASVLVFANNALVEMLGTAFAGVSCIEISRELVNQQS